MPIRFRCAYCNQLLGISRRKAGTVVRCPNCAGQVVVPTLEEAGMNDGATQPPPLPGQQMFEGNEIDRMLEGAAGDLPSAIIGPTHGPSPVAPPAPAAVASASAPPAAPKSAPQAPAPSGYAPAAQTGAHPPGIWLSPARATLLSVIAVVTLAVAFGGGLLVGLFLNSPR